MQRGLTLPACCYRHLHACGQHATFLACQSFALAQTGSYVSAADRREAPKVVHSARALNKAPAAQQASSRHQPRLHAHRKGHSAPRM